MDELNVGSQLSKFAAMAALALLPGFASAQYFDYQENGDVLATFRKTGASQGNYELVVKLGYIQNFLQVSQGTTINITNFTPAQLSDAFPDNYNNLQWAVSAAFYQDPSGQFGPWVFPGGTVWFTRPSTNAASQSIAPSRFLLGTGQQVRQQILSMGDGAYSISFDLSVTNADNNTALVREPISYTDRYVTAFIGDSASPSVGDFRFLPYVVENTTPGTFSANDRADLYQLVPNSDSLHTYTDPITGLTNGAAYYVGYFLLKPDGTMSFTRASVGTMNPPPPPAVLGITHSGTGGIGPGGLATNIFRISFVASNTANYKLSFTNAAGLSTPVTNWPTLPMTIIGSGSATNFMDATTDLNRFYRVRGY